MTTSDEERYEFAEPDNGGCFIPRHGNYESSMTLLSAAADWYDAKVLPRDWKPDVRITISSENIAPYLNVLRSQVKRRYPRPGDAGLS